MAEAIAAAMQFLRKADGGYVSGRIEGELAGYFTSAHVNEDGRVQQDFDGATSLLTIRHDRGPIEVLKALR